MRFQFLSITAHVIPILLPLEWCAFLHRCIVRYWGYPLIVFNSICSSGVTTHSMDHFTWLLLLQPDFLNFNLSASQLDWLGLHFCSISIILDFSALLQFKWYVVQFSRSFNGFMCGMHHLGALHFF